MSDVVIGPNGKRYMQMDPETVQHFVYRLHDAEGEVLYVGLSKNVASRLRAHIRDVQRGNEAKAQWLPQVRDISMVGPLAWLEALDRERDEIERLQPIGNQMYTRRHGWHPRNEPHNPFADTG